MKDRNALENNSKALSLICSPINRGVPPKKYWPPVTKEQEEQLNSIGITLVDFKALLVQQGYAEGNFVKKAVEIDKQADGVKLREQLMRLFWH